MGAVVGFAEVRVVIVRVVEGDVFGVVAREVGVGSATGSLEPSELPELPPPNSWHSKPQLDPEELIACAGVAAPTPPSSSPAAATAVMTERNGTFARDFTFSPNAFKSETTGKQCIACAQPYKCQHRILCTFACRRSPVPQKFPTVGNRVHRTQVT